MSIFHKNKKTLFVSDISEHKDEEMSFANSENHYGIMTYPSECQSVVEMYERRMVSSTSLKGRREVVNDAITTMLRWRDVENRLTEGEKELLNFFLRELRILKGKPNIRNRMDLRRHLEPEYAQLSILGKIRRKWQLFREWMINNEENIYVFVFCFVVVYFLGWLTYTWAKPSIEMRFAREIKRSFTIEADYDKDGVILPVEREEAFRKLLKDNGMMLDIEKSQFYLNGHEITRKEAKKILMESINE